MKKISIIGSTGSIGTQTLDVIRENKELFQVKAMTAHSNINLLVAQIKEFKPEYVAITDESKYKELKEQIGNLCEIGLGREGLLYAASEVETDMLLTAIVGVAGLEPTYAAINKGIDIALANKETLVSGGSVIMEAVKHHKVSLLPVDSEHSAIFQSIANNKHAEIEKLILTASGGPFRDSSVEDLEKVTLQDALKHPNWSMGRKITIDSATMMNKGLEVIEAKWLFHIPVEKIQCVIHPQSIIHSMVEYVDGAVLAQLGTPDMKLPIQYAMTYPHRLPMKGNKLSITDIGTLTFKKPDLALFQCLKLAYDCLKTSNESCIVLNAANEVAVSLFLDEKIRFVDIPHLIQMTLEKNTDDKVKTIEDILDIDHRSRKQCMTIYEKMWRK